MIARGLLLAAVTVGCSRTTLPLPDEASDEPIGICGDGRRWTVTEPQIVAPPTRLDGSERTLALAVAGDRVGMIHDVHNAGRPRFVFRTIDNADVVGAPFELASRVPWSATVIGDESGFLALWTATEGDLFTQAASADGATLGEAVNRGRLGAPGNPAENVANLVAAWRDALIYSVGQRDSPQYLARAPDGSLLPPAVPLIDRPRRQAWRAGVPLRGSRLSLPLIDLVAGPNVDDVLYVVTFDEATKRIERTRELHRAPNLTRTSIVGAPDGTVLITAFEPAKQTHLFSIRGDDVQRTTLPGAAEHGAELVAGADGVAAVITLTGAWKVTNPLPTAFRFAPMRLSDRSIGDPVTVGVAPGSCLETVRVAASGCAFVVAWREGCGSGELSRTLKFARIERR